MRGDITVNVSAFHSRVHLVRRWEFIHGDSCHWRRLCSLLGALLDDDDDDSCHHADPSFIVEQRQTSVFMLSSNDCHLVLKMM